MKVELLLLPISLAFVLANLSCKTDTSEIKDPNTVEKRLREFSSIMHVSFPPSTQLVNYNTIGGIDDLIYLKIKVSREDLSFLINNSPFSMKTLRGSEDNQTPLITSKGPVWWKVKSVKKWKASQARLPQGKYLNILIDLDNQEYVIIYLQWFET